jgi:tRNA pseudouridine32 synthase/23S rRNA pseudouridine746 synthase
LADELGDGEGASPEAAAGALGDADEIDVFSFQRLDLAEDLLCFRTVAGRDDLSGDRPDLASEKICDSFLVPRRRARCDRRAIAESEQHMSFDLSPDRVVYEGENWLVVDKPSGWLTVPGRGDGATPVLGTTLQDRHGRLWPVHRLDREVSGLVLFARNAEAHRAACAWFEGRDVLKTYEALTPWVGGRKVEGEQEWSLKLHRGKKRAFEADHGHLAVTRAQLLGRVERSEQPFAHWRLHPLTGRSHQLRVTLAKFYAPICGDVLYGGPKAESCGLPPGAIALRAVALDFNAVQDLLRSGLPPRIATSGVLA